MASKWFNNDWTLAHFLYYISKIGYILISCYLLLMLLMFVMQLQGSQIGTEDIPVLVEIGKFAGQEDLQLDTETINISKKLTADINITATKNTSTWTVIGFHLLSISQKVVLIFVLYYLSKVFKTIVDEEPFSAKNSTYLFIIGWILFLSPYVYLLISFLTQSYFEHSNFGDLNILSVNSSELSYAPPITGIFIIMLGYVFKEGNRLYKEQQLTV